MSIIDQLLAHPATGYFLSFAGLGILLSLGIGGLHKFFTFGDRAAGVITLCAGAVGGLLLLELGLVKGVHNSASHIGAVFAGLATSAAAAGFSRLDLRRVVVKDAKED